MAVAGRLVKECRRFRDGQKHGPGHVVSDRERVRMTATATATVQDFPGPGEHVRAMLNVAPRDEPRGVIILAVAGGAAQLIVSHIAR
jgi:hypothetical protein